MNGLHPIRLEASFHETIWGGRRLERDGWKKLPSDKVLIGEAWETEISTNLLEPYTAALQSLKLQYDEKASM